MTLPLGQTTCRVEGCDKRLRPAVNKSGYCTAHGQAYRNALRVPLHRRKCLFCPRLLRGDNRSGRCSLHNSTMRKKCRCGYVIDARYTACASCAQKKPRRKSRKKT